MSVPEAWQPSPVRGYSWAPFEKGNTVSTRHGVWSQRKVDPMAEELASGLIVDRPDLAGHPETVFAWARAEARCILLADHFGDGLFDGEGNERPGLRLIAQFERLAADLRARLGLDPRSEAELARERGAATLTAVDLEAVRARGRAAMLEAQGRATTDARDEPLAGPGAGDPPLDEHQPPDIGNEPHEGSS
jgi:hypothetical protein